MNGNKRIAAFTLVLALTLTALACPAAAANYGTASIGFSPGPITYLPAGISGIEPTLNLNFGVSAIGFSGPVQTFSSQNKAGYVVSNESGGASGYRVTLGLSSFSRGLEGATLTILPDEQGLIAATPYAGSPPVFLGGRDSITLEADGLSPMVVLEAFPYGSGNTGLGRWGFNFTGDLNAYTDTILAGASHAAMTWEIVIT